MSKLLSINGRDRSRLAIEPIDAQIGLGIDLDDAAVERTRKKLAEDFKKANDEFMGVKKEKDADKKEPAKGKKPGKDKDEDEEKDDKKKKKSDDDLDDDAEDEEKYDAGKESDDIDDMDSALEDL